MLPLYLRMGVKGFDGGRKRGCFQFPSEAGSIPATSICADLQFN